MQTVNLTLWRALLLLIDLQKCKFKMVKANPNLLLGFHLTQPEWKPYTGTYGWRKPPSLPVGENPERFDWLAGFVDENRQANFYSVWRNPPLQKTLFWALSSQLPN